MSYGGWPQYVSVSEKKEKAQKSLAKLRKKNPNIEPVTIEGSKLVSTWWGKSWNQNLERYADYSNRVGRGKSYVRNGAVLDLKILSGKVTAIVQGSRAAPYNVEVHIDSLTEKTWTAITKSCEGTFGSLPELLEGKFPKELAELFNTKGTGLFPTSSEIKFSCSCPDWADMCKHVAAVLYGIGSKLDGDPKLFFTLRNVNIDELISKTVIEKSKKLLEKSKKKSGRVIESSDISDMFGIDMEFENDATVVSDVVKKTSLKTKSTTKAKAKLAAEAKAKPPAKTKSLPVSEEKEKPSAKTATKSKSTAVSKSSSTRRPNLSSKTTATTELNESTSAKSKAKTESSSPVFGMIKTKHYRA